MANDDPDMGHPGPASSSAGTSDARCRTDLARDAGTRQGPDHPEGAAMRKRSRRRRSGSVHGGAAAVLLLRKASPMAPLPHPLTKVAGDGSVRPGDLVAFNPQPDPPRDPFALVVLRPVTR